MKKILLLVVVVALAVTGFVLMQYETTQADDSRPQVLIGTNDSGSKKAHSHDITLAALKEGRTEYTIHGSESAAYKIRLSEEQVQEILAGTTVMIKTMEDEDMIVKITPAEKKAKKSGW